MLQRPTRLRRTPTVRAMLQETRLCTNMLIAPLFINARLTKKIAIPSMPGHYQLAVNDLPQEIELLSTLNIPAVLLFGIPQHKDPYGNVSLSDNGIIQQAIATIRRSNQEILIIADVCFCEYTNHGHCGVLHGQTIDNEATLRALGKQAVSYARAGADWVAPSSMTDGMVAAIRTALDSEGFHDIAILSYAVKYSSSFYGPFREAAEGAPQFGDRKTYQMDPANSSEALKEARLDIEEGADLLMVKPAMNYLDILYRLKQTAPEIPLCAYQVSGEYAMIKAAAVAGFLNEKDAMLESLTAIKRAGADLIVSYFSKDMAHYLQRQA